MAKPLKEHTVTGKSRKSFPNFAMSNVHPFKQIKGMASSVSTRHRAQQQHCVIEMDKGLHPWSIAKETWKLWEWGRSLVAVEKKTTNGLWIQKVEQRAEAFTLELHPRQTSLMSCCSGHHFPRWSPSCELTDFPSSGESVCLYLENACFSISAIYILHVQNILIINSFIIAWLRYIPQCI